MGQSLSRSRFVLSCLRRGGRVRPLLLAAAACGLATPAAAHGFGQRYELPLPLSLYLFAAGAAVALSFLIFGLFVRHAPPSRAGAGIDLLATGFGRRLAHPIVVTVLKLVAVGLLIRTIAAGLLGDQNPYRNIAPTLVWIIWWVGLVYVSVLFGNLWALINPWRTIFDAAEWCWQWLSGRSLSLHLRYPSWLGVWPACALLLAFAWIELVYPSPAVPAHVAAFALA